jgi:hypothetical protein
MPRASWGALNVAFAPRVAFGGAKVVDVADDDEEGEDEEWRAYPAARPTARATTANPISGLRDDLAAGSGTGGGGLPSPRPPGAT